MGLFVKVAEACERFCATYWGLDHSSGTEICQRPLSRFTSAMLKLGSEI